MGVVLTIFLKLTKKIYLIYNIHNQNQANPITSKISKYNVTIQLPSSKSLFKSTNSIR